MNNTLNQHSWKLLPEGGRVCVVGHRVPNTLSATPFWSGFGEPHPSGSRELFACVEGRRGRSAGERVQVPDALCVLDGGSGNLVVIIALSILARIVIVIVIVIMLVIIIIVSSPCA